MVLNFRDFSKSQLKPFICSLLTSPKYLTRDLSLHSSTVIRFLEHNPTLYYQQVWTYTSRKKLKNFKSFSLNEVCV